MSGALHWISKHIEVTRGTPHDKFANTAPPSLVF